MIFYITLQYACLVLESIGAAMQQRSCNIMSNMNNTIIEIVSRILWPYCASLFLQ